MSRHPSRFLVLASLGLAACSNGAVALYTLDDADGGTDGATMASLPACEQPAFVGAPYGSAEYGATVEASGALSYRSVTEDDAAAPTRAEGTLTAVDSGASRLELTTATGTIDIVVRPVPAAWLDALPVGAEVVAQFENGLTLTHASDDSLLLAVLTTRATRVTSLDVGPLHVAVGAPTCISAFWPTGDPRGCAVGETGTDATVSAEGFAAVLQRGSPATRATIDGHALAMQLVRSAQPATEEQIRGALASGTPPRWGGVCGILLPSELSIVIGPG